MQRPPIVTIIDDDEFVRQAIKTLIRSLGYNAVTFCSAEEFLELTVMLTTECLIVDVQMPGLSGAELQQRLIADGHNFPMIFVTAFPNDRLRSCVFKNGAIGYLSKPFRDHHLIECVSEALKSRGH